MSANDETEYVRALRTDREVTNSYYAKSVGKKTEQQKFLEELIRRVGSTPISIADIACGGGGVSHHLGAMFPAAQFTLIDMNPDAIRMARQVTQHLEAKHVISNIYQLSVAEEQYDLVVCWQTLSWLDKPQEALNELVRVCKTGGRIFASSLFNLDWDVDIYAKVVDHTRLSSAAGMVMSYNTYSLRSVGKWLKDRVSEFRVHKFKIATDLLYNGKGMGTSTMKIADGSRVQVSGGLLMNWGILEVTK